MVTTGNRDVVSSTFSQVLGGLISLQPKLYYSNQLVNISFCEVTLSSNLHNRSKLKLKSLILLKLLI